MGSQDSRPASIAGNSHTVTPQSSRKKRRLSAPCGASTSALLRQRLSISGRFKVEVLSFFDGKNPAHASRLPLLQSRSGHATPDRQYQIHTTHVGTVRPPMFSWIFWHGLQSRRLVCVYEVAQTHQDQRRLTVATQKNWRAPSQVRGFGSLGLHRVKDLPGNQAWGANVRLRLGHISNVNEEWTREKAA